MHGVCECSYACAHAPEVAPWAASKVSKGANAAAVAIPIGDACKQCYEHWDTHFKCDGSSSTWELHLERMQDSAEYKGVVDLARGISSGVARHIPEEYVDSTTTVGVTIKRRFVVLNEAEVATAVGTAKLAKNLKRRLAAFALPKAPDSGTEELFAFRDPEHPYRYAEMTVSEHALAGTRVLRPQDSAWTGEGRAQLNGVVADMLESGGSNAVTTKLRNHGLRTVDEFIASAKSAKQPVAAGSGVDAPLGDECESDGSDSGDGAVVQGPAAGTFRKPLMASPDKPAKPPVPPFASPAQASQKASFFRVSSTSELSVASSSVAPRGSASSSAGGRARSENEDDEQESSGDEEIYDTDDGDSGLFVRGGVFGRSPSCGHDS